ncbi:drug exporter-like protein of the RND superfamily [Kribbella flavida DSM 17836]|uniref:Drug exporter-like protein of the RND superfamily n=1 Tax=Kribbella flavida (strain DSM 17836 / JCM 10339 / NBRC 14399) TaxID=479435 RepID=D2PKF5_KRIFD|nr:MMPL family transporter [Kribbella flavida]ADB30467.1 drug exporter-like protein of the RND superfamily [Kribbella flavida DSM 17836]
MSRFLSRVGAFSAAHRLVVAGAWLVATALFAVLTITGAKFSDAAFSIGGAESTTALATMNKAFPAAPGPATGELMLVVEAPNGTSLAEPGAQKLVTDLVVRADALPEVLSAADPYDERRPFVAEDGSVAVSTLAVDLEADQAAVEHTLREAAVSLTGAGYTIELGGSLDDGPPEIASITEAAGVVVAFVVLLLTFGSLAAAGANMLTALSGVVVGVLGVLAWSSVGGGIQSTTLILGLMLGLAVGIDYALLILSRFRDELRRGADVTAAVARASGTAGTSVVVAGTTVVIALAGLAIVQISFITEMGLGAAFAVVVAVAASLTVVPAVLRTLGYKALPRRERPAADQSARAVVVADHTEAASRSGLLRRWALLVVDRPVLSMLTATVAVAALAVPTLSLETELDPPGGPDPASSQRAAYNTVSEAFGAGEQNPLIVLFEGAGAASTATAATKEIAALAGVVDVSPAQPAEGGNVAFLAVTPEYGPTDARTGELVNALRTAMADTEGAEVSVTGQTAVDVDVDSQLSSGLVTYLICVVGLSLLLLMLVFRSVAVPVLATAGFLMSLAAGLGVTVAVFQWGWAGSLVSLDEARPLASLMPLIVVGVLFGLAMDYQVFLVSRMHEAHRQGVHTRAAVLRGFGQASPIVVAAATIMAAVFAGFAFSGGDAMVASVGLALTVGVLVDALVVRMVLVPAALQLLGEASWWMPRWLDRVLPNVDTEGEALAQDETPETRQELAPSVGRTS